MATPRARRQPEPKAVANEQFAYTEAQWFRLEEIIQRAGSDAARDRFNLQRADFEKMAGAWKARLNRWDGRTLGQDDRATYNRIESAARELNTALGELGFPAIFSGHDVVWKHMGETDENQNRFANFCVALDHIAERAARMAKRKRKRARLMRDRFFRDLGHAWRVEGLPITASVKSPFVAFVESASAGVYEFGNADTARDQILNVIRQWPRRPVCKNRDEER